MEFNTRKHYKSPFRQVSGIKSETNGTALNRACGLWWTGGVRCGGLCIFLNHIERM